MKTEILEFGSQRLKEFDDKFISTGDVASSGNVFAGVIEGIRKDTLYHVLLVSGIVNSSRVKNFPRQYFIEGGKQLSKSTP